MIIDTSGLINIDGLTYKYKTGHTKPVCGWLTATIFNDKDQAVAKHSIPYAADEKRAFITSGCRYKIIKKAVNICDIKFT